MVFQLSKKRHFLQFCVDLNKKSKSVKSVYIYASESFHYTLSENAMVYRGPSNHSWDINDWNIKKYADSAEIQQNSSTSNTNISKTVSHSTINNIIVWKYVTRPFRCIYVNCFNRLRFPAEVSTKIAKNALL